MAFAPFHKCLLWVSIVLLAVGSSVAADDTFRLATFSADVTIPLDHRCMGVLPTKSKKIVDPLYAHGFVLLGGGKPIVICAVDWCEIRNGAYDQWRDALAEAAGTVRQRVLVSSLHQHDAPVTDRGAARLLREVGLPDELYHETFHDDTVTRLPAGATVLGRSSRDAHQVLRWGEQVWSVQFHPEMRARETQLALEWRVPRLLAEGEDPATVPITDAPDGLRLLRAFAQLVRDRSPDIQ